MSLFIYSSPAPCRRILPPDGADPFFTSRFHIIVRCAFERAQPNRSTPSRPLHTYKLQGRFQPRNRHPRIPRSRWCITCLPAYLLAATCCFSAETATHFANAVAVKRSSQLIRPFAFTLESEAASCCILLHPFFHFSQSAPSASRVRELGPIRGLYPNPETTLHNQQPSTADACLTAL